MCRVYRSGLGYGYGVQVKDGLWVGCIGQGWAMGKVYRSKPGYG
jgi:hypothetical protein